MSGSAVNLGDTPANFYARGYQEVEKTSFPQLTTRGCLQMWSVFCNVFYCRINGDRGGRPSRASCEESKGGLQSSMERTPSARSAHHSQLTCSTSWVGLKTSLTQGRYTWTQSGDQTRCSHLRDKRTAIKALPAPSLQPTAVITFVRAGVTQSTVVAPEQHNTLDSLAEHVTGTSRPTWITHNPSQLKSAPKTGDLISCCGHHHVNLHTSSSLLFLRKMQ